MVVSRRSLVRYSGAVALVVVATAIRSALDPYLNERAPLIMYFFAVAIVSWHGGARPGLLTLALGGLAGAYFFIPPRASLAVTKLESIIGLALYFAVGLFIITAAEMQRAARRRAERSAGEAIERQIMLEAEIARREQVEREREALLAEQARLRAMAEEQSATLASLFDQAPVGIVLLDYELRLLRANMMVGTLVGVASEQLIGRRLHEILNSVTHEDETAAIERILRSTLETGEPYSVKGWSSGIGRPLRPIVYLDWSAQRVDRPEGGTLGILCTIVDVTEAVEREQALRKSEELFRLAGEAVDGLIYDFDMTTGRVERTRGLAELLGYQPDEVSPTSAWWFEQVHPDDLGHLLEAAGQFEMTGARSISEYRVRHRDGHYVRVVDRSLAAIDESGKVVRYVGCTQDITEIRQAEQALRDADRRKDEFLAVLAHELRNPLASIRNSLRLMKRPEPGGIGEGEVFDIEPERAMAERQVSHLARLIDDLMDVSRISQGRVELRKEPTELVPILNRAIEVARSSLLERGHNLILDLPDEPIRLEADPTRLEQIFGNLLNNAVKYTPSGGRIWLSARMDGGEAVVEVRDSGLGIEPDMLAKLFVMFVQGQAPLRGAIRTQGGWGSASACPGVWSSCMEGGSRPGAKDLGSGASSRSVCRS